MMFTISAQRMLNLTSAGIWLVDAAYLMFWRIVVKNLAVSVLLLLSLSLIISCGDESGKEADNTTPPPSPAPAATLGDEMIALISVHCVECHNSEDKDGDLDLSTVSKILANAEAIVDSIKDGSMPEDKTLTEEELSLVNAWQAEGYPAPSAGTKVGTDPDAGPSKDNAGQNDDASQNDNAGQNDEASLSDSSNQNDDKDDEDDKKGKCKDKKD